MQNEKQTNKDLNLGMERGFSGTDAKKVKQEIQKDINAGQGAMTSREAGAMRD